MRKKSVVLTTKEEFLKLCKNGVFMAGKKIPTEMKMAELLGVSRETWRSVLDILKREHVVYSKHGVGTYMAQEQYKIKNDLAELKSLSHMISDCGIEEKIPLATMEWVVPPAYIATYLNMKPEQKLCLITRTRISDDSMLCTSCNYILEKYAKEIYPDSIPTSLFDHFEKEVSVYVTNAITKILVPPKDDPIVAMLRNGEDIDILALEQLQFDGKGAPVMLSIDYLRCDVFDFFVTRIRQK